MTRADIIRMAREATDHLSDADSTRLQGIVLLALDAGAEAEREAALDLVDEYAKGNTDLKSAIRARGEK